MRIEVLENGEAVARRAAALIAERARESAAARGVFVAAFSGGRTPWGTLRALAGENIPWEKTQVFQVDERVAPAGDPDRNLTQLRASLAGSPLRPGQIHAMPVEAPDLSAAADEYAGTLRKICGEGGGPDLILLGLGTDGHAASLVPGDAVLEIRDRDVAVTAPYQGRRRMTLTYPVLNRARGILWLVTGSEKSGMLSRLRAGDPSIPAGRVARNPARVLADFDAAEELRGF